MSIVFLHKDMQVIFLNSYFSLFFFLKQPPWWIYSDSVYKENQKMWKDFVPKINIHFLLKC